MRFSSLPVTAAFAIAAFTFQAQALLLTPSTAGVLPGAYGPTNCEPGCIETVFSEDGLALLYKADVGEVVTEEGTFAASYRTTFLNTAMDPSGADISYVGGPVIGCGDCYLAIKDGSQNPGYYFYDLLGWSGTETLELRNFWPSNGAISHVSIWGRSTAVPEPGVLSLLGAGIALIGLRSRRKLLRGA
jgi:hypothetical protein